MQSNNYSFPTVLNFISQYMLSETPDTELRIHDVEEHEIIHIFEASDGDIQINITDDSDDENELDGGGAIMMVDDDDNDCTEWTDIENTLKNGTPEEIAQLVTDKALFAWDLCHER